ncbi:unnamed protein product [Prorocentrum cordatum]|uniref:RNA-directed RNA polymerase n=1 Tax=Prorocentrum cordatum TaxID=2364126 RepID=A0ABN9RIA2_9DINO|nr:unnamed protein product [Polarella glacialis]
MGDEACASEVVPATGPGPLPAIDLMDIPFQHHQYRSHYRLQQLLQHTTRSLSELVRAGRDRLDMAGMVPRTTGINFCTTFENSEQVVAFDTALRPRLKRWAVRSVVRHFKLAKCSNSALRLCIRRRTKTGQTRAESRLFSMGGVLEVAYDYGSRPAVVAALHGISVNSVQTMRRVTAAAFLHCQHLGLGQLVKLCQHTKPSFVISRLAFDETGEKLTVPVPGTSGDAAGTNNARHIFVARLSLHVGWTGRAGMDETVVRQDLVLPNLIFAAPNAPQIIANLFGHKAYTPVFAALDMLRSLADNAISLLEVDGASPNEMFWAHLLDLNRDKSLLDCR